MSSSQSNQYILPLQQQIDDQFAVDLGHGVLLPLPPGSERAFIEWNADVYGSLAISSHRVLHSVLRNYARWSRVRNPVPITFEVAIAYCESLVSRGLKRSTVEAHVWALKMLHEALDVPSPFATKRWKRRWPGILRDSRLNAVKTSKTGLTFDLLDQVLEVIEPDLRGLRDTALLRVAYDSLARRSELVALQWQDVDVQKDGSAHLLIRRSKTDQEARGMLRYLRPATYTALDRWARALVQTGSLIQPHGAIFRPVPRAMDQIAVDRAMQSRQVAAILKKRLGALDLPIDIADYSAHSTRIGAAEDLLASGADLGLVMLAGGWATSTQPVKYARKLNVQRGAMAALARTQDGGLDPDASLR